MTHGFTVFLYTFGLFLGMLLFLEIGRRIAARQRKEDSGTAGEGVGAVDGAVFALLGLLIAFTFSGASSRFDTRRQLIVEETNDIGTAYLRVDLLAALISRRCGKIFAAIWIHGWKYTRSFRTLGQRKQLARSTSCRDKFGAKRLLPAGRRGAQPAARDTTATRAERDDRYHDDPNHGDPDASADSRLRNAFRIGAGSFAISRLWHDRQQGA